MGDGGGKQTALLRQLWQRNHRTASVMDQFYGRCVGRCRLALPRSAKPAAKFVKVHCVAGQDGRMDASVILRTAERVPRNYRALRSEWILERIEGPCGER